MNRQYNRQHKNDYEHPRMTPKQRALNSYNPGRQYRSEEQFSARLDEIDVQDARVVLLRDIYNAGTAGKRLDCEQVLEESRKYYPSCFTLQDVFEDLIAQTPRQALADVQYAFVCYYKELADQPQPENGYKREAAQPALSLG